MPRWRCVMRWEGQRESDNVEDRRGMPVKGVATAGGGLLLVINVVFSLLTGKDPTPLPQQLPQGQSQTGGGGGDAQTAGARVDPTQEPLRKFVAVVLADTEDVWGELFPKYFNKPYERPKLVLFTARVESACGLASAASGPFY